MQDRMVTIYLFRIELQLLNTITRATGNNILLKMLVPRHQPSFVLATKCCLSTANIGATGRFEKVELAITYKCSDTELSESLGGECNVCVVRKTNNKKPDLDFQGCGENIFQTPV